jgi:hypothetical protein
MTEGQKEVWIKCRANESCEGNNAVIVTKRTHQPLTAAGGFNAQMGGATVRYRCLTCKGTFHVTN